MAATEMSSDPLDKHKSIDLRGLRLAEYGLFVTVCRHRLPARDQENESPIGFRRPGISVWQPGVDGRQGQRAGPSDVADSGRCGRRGGIPARAVPREALAGGPCPAASAGIAVTGGRYAR